MDQLNILNASSLMLISILRTPMEWHLSIYDLLGTYLIISFVTASL